MAYSLSIAVTQNSQDITNNRSNVTVKVNCSWTYGTWSAENLTKYCTIDGTTHYFSDVDINPNATTSGSSTLFTWTGYIPHNSDGTKSLSVYASTATTNSSGTQTASKTTTLTTIPRKSTVSATNAVVGSNSTITISRKSSAFTHTLTYTFGSLSGTIATKTSSTSVAFTLPTTFYAQIGANATSKAGTITCTTYNGNTAVGSTTCSFTASTSQATCAPTLSPTVTDVNSATVALTGDANKLVKYYSTAAVTFGAAARNSATLSSKSVSNSGKSRTSDGNITEVTSGTFEFSAKDSRGYTASKTITKTLIEYVKLTCSFNVKVTVDGTATITTQGNYFNGSFGAASNTLSLQYRYKANDGEFGTWANITAALDGNNYSAAATINGLDYQKVYEFEVKAADKLATITPSPQSVKAQPVFDWGENDFNINGDLTVNGDLEVKGEIKPIEILEGTDLNTITEAGIYYCPLNVTAETLINSPIKKAFALEVLKTTDVGCTQRITPYHPSYKGIYTRRTYQNEYGEWEHIPSGITYKRGTQSFTSSTSWFYTGAKITIPANCIFGVNADFVYSYNAPRGGAFASRSDNVNYIWQEGLANTYGCAISYTGVTYPTSVQEIYLWAKYAGASSNYVNYTYWYIPLPS